MNGMGEILGGGGTPGGSAPGGNPFSRVFGSPGSPGGLVSLSRGLGMEPPGQGGGTPSVLEQFIQMTRQPEAIPDPGVTDTPPEGAQASTDPLTPRRGTEFIRYANQGAIRNQPVSPELEQAFGKFLPDMGITVEVFSGGQPGKGSGGKRVGSTRHDHGNAADVRFYRNGEQLDWRNPEHLPVFQEIVRRGREAGITGFGAGEGYMSPGTMHIGFGTPAVWGAGGRGSNAPGWLREAYAGGGPTVQSAAVRPGSTGAPRERTQPPARGRQAAQSPETPPIEAPPPGEVQQREPIAPEDLPFIVVADTISETGSTQSLRELSPGATVGVIRELGRRARTTGRPF